MQRVAIIDYGSGNLHSAAKAFERAAREGGTGASVLVTANPDEVRAADRIVLPGVGAFADCKAGLDAVPGMVEALVESVRATLAGDRAQLERHYRVQFSGRRDTWRLHLVPRSTQVRAHVESITVSGAAARAQRIEVLESSGDRSVMTIVHDGK